MVVSFVVVVVQWSVMLVFVVIVGVLAPVLDFREVMLTSPPQLAHCAPTDHRPHQPYRTTPAPIILPKSKKDCHSRQKVVRIEQEIVSIN